MRSKIVQALSPAWPAVGLYRSAAVEPEAKIMSPRTSLRGGWGCAMHLFAQAFEGRVVAFSSETCRCPGAAHGLGLAPSPFPFPGGPEGSLRLLSCGNRHWEDGRRAVEELRSGGASEEVLDEFENGEGFKKDPRLTLETFRTMPRLEPNAGYLICKPLERFETPPEAVVLLVDALQLSALTVLANFARPGFESVMFPFAAGCMSVGLLPLSEIGRPAPRAVAGLTDISARLALRRLLGRTLVSFAMPCALFAEMEDNVEASFLSRRAWRRLGGPADQARAQA